MTMEAFGGELEQFRHCFEIPVGVADVDMAQVGCEFRQFTPNVETGAIPFDEPTCREAVTKILKPRTTTDASAPGGLPQPDSTGQSGECTAGCTAMQPFATFGDEKRLRLTSRDRVLSRRFA
jgi:hypothetical protein